MVPQARKEKILSKDLEILMLLEKFPIFSLDLSKEFAK